MARSLPTKILMTIVILNGIACALSSDPIEQSDLRVKRQTGGLAEVASVVAVKVRTNVIPPADATLKVSGEADRRRKRRSLSIQLITEGPRGHRYRGYRNRYSSRPPFFHYSNGFYDYDTSNYGSYPGHGHNEFNYGNYDKNNYQNYETSYGQYGQGFQGIPTVSNSTTTTNGSISTTQTNVTITQIEVNPEIGTTKTQIRFAKINTDLAAAVRYKESFRKFPMVSRDIVINPSGVSCADICEEDEPDVTHGMLGICTRNFCTCQLQLVTGRNNYRQDTCPIGHVFDPRKRACDVPQNTVLCSDDPVLRLNGNSLSSVTGAGTAQRNGHVILVPVSPSPPPVQYYLVEPEQPQQTILVSQQPQQNILVSQQPQQNLVVTQSQPQLQGGLVFLQPVQN